MQPQGCSTSWGGTCLSFPTLVNARSPASLIQITAVTDLPERAVPAAGILHCLGWKSCREQRRSRLLGVPLAPQTSPHSDPAQHTGGPPARLPHTSALAAKHTPPFPDSPEAPAMGFIPPAKRIDVGPARKSQDSQQDPALLSLISLE